LHSSPVGQNVLEKLYVRSKPLVALKSYDILALTGWTSTTEFRKDQPPLADGPERVRPLLARCRMNVATRKCCNCDYKDTPALALTVYEAEARVLQRIARKWRRAM
jgi:hypothetical protein